jgi:SNF2 family DNA or RNA helicase
MKQLSELPTSPPVPALWEHQAQYVTQDALKPDWALLWEPRCGKSLATLAGVERWVRELGVTRILIVAPKTVCRSVWAPETRKTLSGCLGTLDLFDGPLESRKAALRAIRGRQDPLAVIVNYDALASLENSLLAWKPQAIILDEGHAVKSPSSNRHRSAFKVARGCQFRRVLTGTVAPNGLIDLYGIWKVLSPRIFGTRLREFQARYCIMDAKFPNRVNFYRNVGELREKAFAIADIRQRKDCFDIPPVQEIERLVQMPQVARRMYDKIVNDHVLELTRATHIEEIPMTHTFSRITQLTELATGYVRHGEAGNRTVEWIHDEIIDLVLAEVEDIVESGKKIVVFHNYTPEGEHLTSRLRRAGYHPLTLNGQVDSEVRQKNIERFASDPDAQIMIAQEQVSSLGISFATADYAIFLSMSNHYDRHKQAQDRIFQQQNAEGTIKKTLIYPLAENTILPAILARVRNKASIENYLMTGDRAQQFKQLAYGSLD